MPLNQDQAKKLIDGNLINIARKVADGRTLTKLEMELLQLSQKTTREKELGGATSLKPAEALQHHRNIIYRKGLEKLKSGEPLGEDELVEVSRRQVEEEKKAAKLHQKEKIDRGGPRSKLTRLLIRRLCEHIAEGKNFKTSCKLCGISQPTYYRWLETPPETSPLFRELQESIEEAKAKNIAWNIAQIRKAASNGSWQASVWALAMADPETYGRKDTIRTEISGPNGQPLPQTNVAIIYMPDNGFALPQGSIDVTEPKQITQNGNGHTNGHSANGNGHSSE